MKTFKIIVYSTIIILLVFSCNYLVFADDIDTESLNNISSYIETSSSVSTEPVINSRAAIIFDRISGSVLFGKNENEVRKMASTTKIMTAIIVIENSNLDDVVTVSSKAAGTGGSRLGLHTNDKITVKDLLYGLLLCSGNDSAVALAEHVGGDIAGFSDLMNKKCTELNLSSSHFVTPHGLDDDNHYTTAYELALIANYALKNNTFCNIVGSKTYTVTINNIPKSLSNTNELLGNLNGVYGVKTGFTNGANRCLVTSIKRGNMDLISVVLGADTKKDRTNDSVKIIEYAFNNFEYINIKEKINSEFENWKLCNCASLNVKKGVSNNLDITLDDIPYEYFPVNKNNENKFNIYIYCNYYFEAPLMANSIIGYLTVSIDNETILTLNITNRNSIVQKSCTDFFSDMIYNYVGHLESIFFH